MDPWFELLGAWWWVAPTGVGAAAAGYGAVTSRGRRARRLELDAARYDEGLAHQALQAARVEVRTARAEVLAARARSGVPSIGGRAAIEARQVLLSAKQAERAASLRLRASRGRVKASRARYRALFTGSPLPLEALMSRHDAVTSRWLEYETDAAKALSFPQMLDAQHPSTLAFLCAQREAHGLRPASARDRMTPPQFAAYRDAVSAVERTFAEAERSAQGTARSDLPTAGWRDAVLPLVERLPGLLAAAMPPAAAAETRAPAPRQAEPPRDTAAAADPRPPAWPVPARRSSPSRHPDAP